MRSKGEQEEKRGRICRCKEDVVVMVKSKNVTRGLCRAGS